MVTVWEHLKWLPRGYGLSADSWRVRHRALLIILWLHLPVLATIGVVKGNDAVHVVVEVGALALLGAMAYGERSRMRSAMVSVALASCSAVLIHYTGGLIEAHFHFFVILPLIALYQDWRPFLAGMAYVLIHHGVMGAIDPRSVYNHPAAIARPLLWAVIHTGFILALVAVLIFQWQLAEQATDEIRAKEARFRSLFDEAPIGMVLFDAEDRVIEVNAALASLIGRGTIGQSPMQWKAMFGESDFEAFADALASVRATGAPVTGMEVSLVGENQTVWAQVAISAVGSGPKAQVIVQVEDVTRQREDRQRLEQLVRSKDEFVASVSHELRTPLSAVVGFADLLSDRDSGMEPAERFELIDVIATQSREVSHIVEDLLVAARSEIGMVSVAPTEIDLAIEVTRALDTLSAAVRDRVEVRSGAPTAFADAGRTRQVIRNLVTNADRYGGDKIWIEFSYEDGRARIDVCDDGDGIPPKLRTQVFEAYGRAHARPTQPGSVGLGLTISRTLAELMGGSLSYHREGGVSVFRLEIPGARSSSERTVKRVTRVATRY